MKWSPKLMGSPHTGGNPCYEPSILQLGDEEVSLATEEMDDVDPIETHTCCITVFQDEIQFSWSTFVAAPIRSARA